MRIIKLNSFDQVGKVKTTYAVRAGHASKVFNTEFEAIAYYNSLKQQWPKGIKAETNRTSATGRESPFNINNDLKGGSN